MVKLMKENRYNEMVLIDEYVNQEQAERKAVSNGPGYYRTEYRGECLYEFRVGEGGTIERA